VADPSDSIFREVDEDVRRDLLVALWRRYGVYLVSGLVAIIAGVLGFQLWEDYREGQMREEAGIYMDAVSVAEDAEPVVAATLLEEAAQKLDGGYRLLIDLRRAHALREAGRMAEALSLYDAVAAQAENTILAAFSAYLAAGAALQVESPDAAIARLSPMAVPDSPFYYSLTELLGAAYLQAGDEAGARAQFSALADDPEAPPQIAARAEEMLAVLGEAGSTAAASAAASTDIPAAEGETP